MPNLLYNDYATANNNQYTIITTGNICFFVTNVNKGIFVSYIEVYSLIPTYSQQVSVLGIWNITSLLKSEHQFTYMYIYTAPHKFSQEVEIISGYFRMLAKFLERWLRLGKIALCVCDFCSDLAQQQFQIIFFEVLCNEWFI